MSRLTVDEIQSRIAAVVDQDENTSNLSTTDYSLRLKYLNMSQREWAELTDWRVLYSEYNSRTSTATGNTSVALPEDFRKLASYPAITYDGANTAQFPETLPVNDKQYTDTDKRVLILGSPNGGYYMRVLGTDLASGASIKVPYYRSPVSLVSPSNIADIPNSDYLVQRTIAHIWEAREDARFPQAKADAEQILINMLEFENSTNRASDYDRSKTVEETKFNFSWGKDG